MHTVLSRLFAGAQAVGVQGVFQFVFDARERHWAAVDDQVQVQAGQHPAADVTLELAQADFLGILAGQRDVEALFASGALRVSGQMGLATLLPQMIDAARRGEAPPTQARGLNQRYPAPPRHADKVSARQPALTTIERVPFAAMSVERFQASFQASGTPVVITQALVDWPLFNMPREASAAYFIDVQGISRHGDYVSKTFSTERDFRSESMAAFIARLDEPLAPGERPPYMGNNAVPEQVQGLIRTPAYFAPQQYLKPRIWIGPRGTLTPLHRDDSDNLFAQVWGSKRFILAAPHHRDALGCWATSPEGGLEGCDFNPDAPDYQRFPLAKEVPLLEVMLSAGDLLYLPDGWFHQVESATTSLSVNFWLTVGRGWGG